ncbi:meiotic nuclear division protein 1, putative (MND1) [Babesia microti strain RI]|uniref:Meiotic nuclear division protein 1, putative (MND1) n=1 Tax=Babesia microti (strain RI) TaxID=1133968 RepID=A0A1N6LWR6_BABMR|nr:meiotic nuclear division protein 1, putative (MND1) [Babesia microti strain RI]SIO73311.1 meiotic nuclear division protein 1, putative (MND1) [Babesia microti strain RI]|eukprot:XP_021337413.1 meiotic nuclear division protein 1, putative (MND1) [Babesia microti strain RI]
MKWLVDENMIMQNKMGSINIYWTLASEEYSMLDRKRHNLQNILTKESQNLLIEKERQTELIERVYDLSNKSDETTPKKDRKSKIPIDIEKLNHEQVSRQLDNVRLELTKYENMLSKMKIMELYSIESLKSQIELATIATQRWNDNILSVKCWFTKHVLNNN